MGLEDLAKYVQDTINDKEALKKRTASFNEMFNLDEEQMVKLLRWEHEQDVLTVQIQREEIKKLHETEPCFICKGTGFGFRRTQAQSIDDGPMWEESKDIPCETCGGSKKYTSWGFEKRCQEQGYPHYGCCGGQLSYIFTPTSIGTCVEVKHSISKNTLDLTYEF